MSDDYEIDDLPCPKCGNANTHSRRCSNFGCEDGYVDEYEDDPINNSPGDYTVCPDCLGHGIERWCPACGGDYWVEEARAARSGAICACTACNGSGNGPEHECDACNGAGWVRVVPLGEVPQ